MPALTARCCRAALAFLALGAMTGTVLMVLGAGHLAPLAPFRSWLLAAHVELLLLGFAAQTALAVAYWILPRLEGRRPRSGLAVAALLLLNGGLLAVVAAGPLAAIVPDDTVYRTATTAGLRTGGRLAELAAALLFLAHAFPRILVVTLREGRSPGRRGRGR